MIHATDFSFNLNFRSEPTDYKCTAPPDDFCRQWSTIKKALAGIYQLPPSNEMSHIKDILAQGDIICSQLECKDGRSISEKNLTPLENLFLNRTLAFFFEKRRSHQDTLSESRTLKHFDNSCRWDHVLYIPEVMAQQLGNYLLSGEIEQQITELFYFGFRIERIKWPLDQHILWVVFFEELHHKGIFTGHESTFRPELLIDNFDFDCPDNRNNISKIRLNETRLLVNSWIKKSQTRIPRYKYLSFS